MNKSIYNKIIHSSAKILIMTILITLVVLPYNQAFAEGDAGGTINAPTLAVTALQGSDTSHVDVRVDISNNPGISSLGFRLDYDSSNFELTSIDDEFIISHEPVYSEHYTDDPYYCSWIGETAEGSRYNGELITFHFTKKQSATQGNCTFSVTNVDAVDFFLLNGQAVQNDITFKTVDDIYYIAPKTSSINITGNPSKSYDGTPVSNPSVSKTGSTGLISFEYFTNEECTIRTTTVANGAYTEGAAPIFAGNYWVKATLESDSNYQSAIKTKAFTITKADVTGKPSYISVNDSGKTLKDAALGTGNLYPAGGTIKWVNQFNTQLAFDTLVVQGNSYKWEYTPSDFTNFNKKTGMVVLWTVVTPPLPPGGDGGIIPAGGDMLPVEEPSSIVNDEKNATTTAQLEASTSGGQTTAEVDELLGDEIVDKAVENKSRQVIINAARENPVVPSEVPASVKAVIPTKTLKELADVINSNLVIKTDAATVEIDETALDSVIKSAGTSSKVELLIETKSSDNNKVEIELKIKTASGDVTSFNGGNVKVTINITKEMQGKEIVCVYVDEKGQYIKMKGQKNDDGTYTFVTGHFSTYIVMTDEEANATIAQQEKAGIIAGVNATTIKVKTSAVKGKIVVLWSKSKGYKINYFQVFRATKKTGTYKYVAKTSRTQLANKKGLKAGKTYYYKVRGVRLVDGKKIYTRWSNFATRRAK